MSAWNAETWVRVVQFKRYFLIEDAKGRRKSYFCWVSDFLKEDVKAITYFLNKIFTELLIRKQWLAAETFKVVMTLFHLSCLSYLKGSNDFVHA